MALPRKLFATLDLPILTALLHDARLQLVDIGGRGSAFYPLLTLAPFAEYFVFEPDEAEAERLTESLRPGGRGPGWDDRPRLAGGCATVETGN